MMQAAHPDALLGVERNPEEQLVLRDLLLGRRGQVNESMNLCLNLK